MLLQLLKRGRKPRPRRLLAKLLMRPPENKVNSHIGNCLRMMWPAKKPSPAPTRAPSTLEFPVKNNGADNICWEHRRSTRVGINMVLVVVYQLNSSVPYPTFLLYFDWEFWVEFPEYNEWCERFFLFVL